MQGPNDPCPVSEQIKVPLRTLSSAGFERQEPLFCELRFAGVIPILQWAKLRNGEVNHFVQDARGRGGHGILNLRLPHSGFCLYQFPGDAE